MNQSARDPFKISSPADDRSLVDVVEDRLRTLIESGVLRAGERLPPTRELAARAGVNRGVLLKAIHRLEAAGRLTTRIGSGVTVGEGAAAEGSDFERGRSPEIRFSSAISRVHLAEAAPPAEREVIADFSRLAPDERFFPIGEFVEILASTSRRHKELWGYSNPTGLRDLRREIARRLADSGAPWGEEDILVTSGAQQGLDLLFKTFVDPGDAVAVESPTYPGILPLLRFFGAEIVEIPVDRGARDFSRLFGRSVRLVYTMPEGHNPTGSTMDAGSRRRFLAAALGSGALVVEDGYERPSSGQPPLCAIERARVVSLGSFSKDLVPGIRLGWIAAGRRVLRALSVAKQTTDLQTPLPLQAATAEFLEKGLDAGVFRQRADEIRARRAIAVEAISRLLPGASFRDEPGSPIVWLELPVGSSGRETARVAALAGVRVAAGADFDPFGRDLPAIRLSVSRIDRSAISEGILRLSKAIETVQREAGSALAIPAL